jgi:hypothetical protein
MPGEGLARRFRVMKCALNARPCDLNHGRIAIRPYGHSMEPDSEIEPFIFGVKCDLYLEHFLFIS